MKSKQIMVTGIGVIGDFGAGKGDFIRFFDERPIIKKVEEIEAQDYMDASQLRRADVTSCFASVASKLAFDDAGLKNGDVPSERIGLVVGTTHGPVGYAHEYHREIVLGDPTTVSPLLFSNSLANTMASYIGNIFKIKGQTTTLSGYNAVFSSVKYACELIKDDIVDVCLVGGADIYNDIISEPYAHCRVDNKKLAGFFGGSGIMLLESIDHAKKRGAKLYCEVISAEMMTASLEKMREYGVSPVDRLFGKNKRDINRTDLVLSAAFREKECLYRQRFFIEKFAGNVPVFNCSKYFEETFSAGEIFEIICGILLAKGEIGYNNENGNIKALGSASCVIVSNTGKRFSNGILLLGGS